MAGLVPVPVQMWRGWPTCVRHFVSALSFEYFSCDSRRMSSKNCRCGTGEPSPSEDVADETAVSRVPVQMWEG